MNAKIMVTDSDQSRPYLHGYDSALTTRWHAGRSAEKQGRFLLPYLQPGMTLLDCGCGSGSITLGLAKIVAPGQVIGVDLSTVEIDRARLSADQQKVTTVRFATGDLYHLDYVDASFDALFCHNVLEHLDDPLAALREMQRVLTPGGVIGVRDTDMGGILLHPPDPSLLEWFALYEADWCSVRGDSRFGRRLPGMLRQAGFGTVKPMASYDIFGDRQGVALTAEVASSRCHDADYRQRLANRGLATPARLAELADAWLAWAEHPDAFFAVAHGEAVGWKEI
ncbi:MAG TPA: methyltransferase domain-containing protein [Caldilineaceae bacterium]|nr:methyltransferase domain-containing protein [Caldilineaceae bacterium]